MLLIDLVTYSWSLLPESLYKWVMILAGFLTCVLLLTFPPKKGSGFVVCNEHPPIGELSLQLREQFQNIQFRIINSYIEVTGFPFNSIP
jgi:hypothetical protein